MVKLRIEPDMSLGIEFDSDEECDRICKTIGIEKEGDGVDSNDLTQEQWTAFLSQIRKELTR